MSATVFDAISSPTRATMMPRIFPSVRPVIYLHGAAADAGELAGKGLQSPRLMMRTIADAGVPIGCITCTQLWGNSTVTTTTTGRVDTMLAYLRANCGATNDAPILVGASMGADCAYQYARSNPVHAIAGVIPALDVDDIRNNDRGGIGLRAAIDAAWSVSYPAPLPAGANPATATGSFLTFPQYLAYASDDTIAIPSATTTFGAATGATLVNVGALGHSEAAITAAASALAAWVISQL